MDSLINLLDSYNWNDKDEYVWRWDKTRIFSVKSYYRFLNQGGLRCPYFNVIWNDSAPIKVRVHTCLVVNNYLLTGENLRLRHLSVTRKCMFCDVVEESHIFLECPFVQPFWDYFRRRFSFPCAPKNIEEWWSTWRVKYILKSNLIIWDIVMMAYVWVLWKERNERIFANTYLPKHLILNSLLFFVRFWVGNLKSDGNKQVDRYLALLSDQVEVGIRSGNSNLRPLELTRLQPSGASSRDSPHTSLNHIRSYSRRKSNNAYVPSTNVELLCSKAGSSSVRIVDMV